MIKVVDVSMICFKSILLKKTLEEADELDENDNDDADE